MSNNQLKEANKTWLVKISEMIKISALTADVFTSSTNLRYLQNNNLAYFFGNKPNQPRVEFNIFLKLTFNFKSF